MTVNDVNQLIESAVALLKTGDRVLARAFLVQALRIDPRHEMATLWLSGTSDTPVQQRRILKRVLEINPANQVALRGLAILDRHDLPVDPVPQAVPVIAGVWSPPDVLSPDQLILMPTECAQCAALVYGNTSFCWRCHSAVHCCATCEFRAVQECKQAQGIQHCDLLNACPWWRPGL